MVLTPQRGTLGHVVRPQRHPRRQGALAVKVLATAVGRGRGQGPDGARPCRRGQAPVDELLVTSVLRSIQAMPRAEVLSTNVLHRYRIVAIIEQALRLPSGRTV